MQFLLFTLYAPMGSFGEIAVGERRMGWARPARSSVLGLVAGSLGIERTDEKAHRDLQAGLFYAVRTDAAGRPFTDYHTAQTPVSRKGQTYATRRSELASERLHTVLSSREWRSDSYFTVSLWARAAAEVDLHKLAGALRHPHFVPYLGRKAAVLGLPLNPCVVAADTLLEALDKRLPTGEEKEVLDCIGAATGLPMTIACDHDAHGIGANARIERRRDAVISRERWQFADRLEAVIELPAEGRHD